MIGSKGNVIKYVNRAAKRQFGPPSTEIMTSEWVRQEEEIHKLEKNKHSFCPHIAKWPNLEAEMKKWKTDHRNNRFFVCINFLEYT
jgi:peptidoglycan/xylan/chitin deacetylase (PgdA/CDA1 family)